MLEPGDGDPLRSVALVVGTLAVVFGAVLVAVQLDGRPESALTLPLVVLTPVALAVVYWYVRFR